MPHLTPKLREAVIALYAAGGELTRCRGGWHHHATRSGIVTMRTARALSRAGLAAFDCELIPSLLFLTEAGRSAGAELQCGRAA